MSSYKATEIAQTLRFLISPGLSRPTPARWPRGAPFGGMRSQAGAGFLWVRSSRLPQIVSPPQKQGRAPLLVFLVQAAGQERVNYPAYASTGGRAGRPVAPRLLNQRRSPRRPQFLRRRSGLGTMRPKGSAIKLPPQNSRPGPTCDSQHVALLVTDRGLRQPRRRHWRWHAPAGWSATRRNCAAPNSSFSAGCSR